MTRAVAEEICNTIGEVQKSTGAADEEGGMFIRVRVLVDISLPLCRGRLITLEDGRKIWTSFKYERLPKFCLWCGRLNHSDKDCELWIESRGTLKPEQQQFNLSLKADPYTTAGKEVIYVPGYYEQRNPKASASPQAWHAQPSSSEGRGERGDPVEEQSMEMATAINADGFTEFNGGEPCNPINLEEVNALLSVQKAQLNPVSISSKSIPLNAPNIVEGIKETENLIPNTGFMSDLVDIQIREIDGALMNNGQSSNGSEKLTAANLGVSNSPTQHSISAKNQRARQAAPRATRKQKNTAYGRSKLSQTGREKIVTEAQVERKSGGKRRGVAHPELPSKHRRVSEDEGVSFYSMVEADVQPRQLP